MSEEMQRKAAAKTKADDRKRVRAEADARKFAEIEAHAAAEKRRLQEEAKADAEAEDADLDKRDSRHWAVLVSTAGSRSVVGAANDPPQRTILYGSANYEHVSEDEYGRWVYREM